MSSCAILGCQGNVFRIMFHLWRLPNVSPSSSNTTFQWLWFHFVQLKPISVREVVSPPWTLFIVFWLLISIQPTRAHPLGAHKMRFPENFSSNQDTQRHPTSSKQKYVQWVLTECKIQQISPQTWIWNAKVTEDKSTYDETVTVSGFHKISLQPWIWRAKSISRTKTGKVILRRASNLIEGFS